MINNDSLILTIKMFDATLPYPNYHSARAVGLDLYCRTDCLIEPHTTALVPLNIAIKLPIGYWAMLVGRSSLHKMGLMLANGVGVIDPDFAGDQDECQAILLNFSKQVVQVKRGMRLVQLVICSAHKPIVNFVERLSQQSRGGIGSTGVY